MEADRKKLIDKIAKLLALADSSDFSEEAKTAKNLAAELLAKHDIAACELTSEAYEKQREESERFAGHDVTLYGALARINGCAMYMCGAQTLGECQGSVVTIGVARTLTKRATSLLASLLTLKPSNTCEKSCLHNAKRRSLPTA